MLSFLRRIARPLGFFVVLAMAAPAVALDCREISAMSGDMLPCCKSSQDGLGLNNDCCAVRTEQAGSSQPTTATAGARSASQAVLATSALLTCAGPALMPAFSVMHPADTGPPPDRLYIRFSVIRR